MINIEGVDKYRVLSALYGRAREMIMGAAEERDGEDDHAPQVTMPPALSDDEAKAIIIGGGGKLEAVNFVLIGVDLSGDEVDPSRYDAQYGDGEAQRAIEAMLLEETPAA